MSEDKFEIDKFKKKERTNFWKAEDTIVLETLMKSELTVNRIIYIGPNSAGKKAKRCISITKNGKSVSFDVEMAKAIAASITQLGKGYELKEVI